MTRRVVLLVAAVVLAAGAAAGTYFALRGAGGGLPASPQNPLLEGAKRQGLVTEYHPLYADADAARTGTSSTTES